MLKYILLFFLSFYILGCSENTSNTQENSKYLTIARAPANADAIEIEQTISLGFSAVLDTNTINEESAYIEDENGTKVGVVLGIGNPDSKIDFTPYTYFPPETNLRVVITTSIKDKRGRSLSEQYIFAFTTVVSAGSIEPPTIRALKPNNNATSVNVHTNIVIDFSKDMSTQAQYEDYDIKALNLDVNLDTTLDDYSTYPSPTLSGSGYMRVYETQTGIDINGTIEIFNSLFKFIPNAPLPYDTNITAQLLNPITDLYGNVSPTRSWSFKTQTQAQNPNGDGFGSSTSYELNKKSYLVRTLDESRTASTIVLGTKDSVDIYTINYAPTQTKPTFSKSASFALNSKVTAMEVFGNEFVVVGTQSDGFYTLQLNESGIIQIGQEQAGNGVYGLHISDAQDRVYAAGPKVGVHKYDLNIETGALSAEISFTDVVEALDVVEYMDSYYGTKKILVADYNGAVLSLDENLSLLSKTDLNASIKLLNISESYEGDIDLFAIASSGKVQGLYSDGSINDYVTFDLIGSVSDFTFYVSDYEYLTYYANGSKGVTIKDGFGYTLANFQTGGDVVSSSIINSPEGLVYLVTLNTDGKLQLFNAIKTIATPSDVTLSVANGNIVAVDANITLDFTANEFIDQATLSKDTIILTKADGSAVEYTLTSNGLVYTINPKTLDIDTNYVLILSSNISDLMGNTLDGGEDRNISFVTEGGVIPTSPIVAGNTVLDVSESLKVGDIIGRVSLDDGGSALTSVSLSGVGSEKFSIADNGDVSLLSSLDYETISIYNLSVEANNSIGGDSGVLNIAVNDYINPFQVARLVPQETPEVNYGESSAISGNYMVVGEKDKNRAIVFKKQLDGTVVELSVLYPQVGATEFGASVAIDGNYIVVGATNDIGYTYYGVAYLYKIVDDTNISLLSPFSASDGNNNALFGTSVDISGDYIVVGATGSDVVSQGSSEGAAYVFKVETNETISELVKLTDVNASYGALYGCSVGIDGNNIVIGAKRTDINGSTDTGSAFLYRKYADNDISLVSYFLPSDVYMYDNFGASISIDGDYIVVGADRAEGVVTNSGTAYLFKSNVDSVTELAKVYASDGVLGSQYGISTAISGDYFTVGSLNITSESPLVYGTSQGYLYKRNSDLDVSLVQKISATDTEYRGATAMDGDSILVGGYLFDLEAENRPYIYSSNSYSIDESFSDTFVGGIFAASPNAGVLTYELSGIDSSVFTFNENNVSFSSVADYENPQSNSGDNDYNITVLVTDIAGEITTLDTLIQVKNKEYLGVKQLLASDIADNDAFAKAVATDGNYTIVGAYLKDFVGTDSGVAYLYKHLADGSMNEIAKIQSDDIVSGDNFGSSVAIDGDYIVIGASRTGSDVGSAYIFRRNSDTFNDITQIAKIQASTPSNYASFGNAISISGDYIAVGSKESVGSPGSAYLFKRFSDTNVTQIALLQASDRVADDYFGTSISISGDYIVVGATGQEIDFYNSGAAYVFRRNSDTLDDVTELARLKATSPEDYAAFGISVSIDANYIVVGSDSEANYEGGAYLFEKIDDANIVLKSHFVASDKSLDDRFGASVSMDGDTIVVGAYMKDNYTGSAYVFQKDTLGVVTQVEKIKPIDNAKTNGFGSAVSVSGSNVVVGAHYDASGAINGGAAYTYKKDPTSVGQ